MSRRFLISVCSLILLAGLVGCASLLRADAPPLLRLSPASMGRELTVAQRLDVQVGNQTRSVDVALEIDAEAVRMAFMQYGQTVAHVVWDGQHLEQRLAPGWPKVVSAEQVLNDLQLVWWPLAQVQAALPQGWTVTDTFQRRELRHGDRVVVTVRVIEPGHIELIQRADGYTLQVHSQGATPEFAAP
ncbi:MAG: DUF3261 domain-containing protein [Pseudomonadota bacterium]